MSRDTRSAEQREADQLAWEVDVLENEVDQDAISDIARAWARRQANVLLTQKAVANGKLIPVLNALARAFQAGRKYEEGVQVEARMDDE